MRARNVLEHTYNDERGRCVTLPLPHNIKVSCRWCRPSVWLKKCANNPREFVKFECGRLPTGWTVTNLGKTIEHWGQQHIWALLGAAFLFLFWIIVALSDAHNIAKFEGKRWRYEWGMIFLSWNYRTLGSWYCSAFGSGNMSLVNHVDELGSGVVIAYTPAPVNVPAESKNTKGHIAMWKCKVR